MTMSSIRLHLSSARASAALVIAVAMATTGCRSGIFDNEDPRWRVPESQLRRIEATDPTAASLAPPVTLEDAAKEALASIEVPAAPEGGVALSLADVRSAVLANNLDLRTILVDPAIARANLSAEEAKFEGVFFAEYDRSNNSVFADLATGENPDADSFNAGFSLPLATGGEISLSSPLTRGAHQARGDPHRCELGQGVLGSLLGLSRARRAPGAVRRGGEAARARQAACAGRRRARDRSGARRKRYRPHA
jgi:hypothetical protein